MVSYCLGMRAHRSGIYYREIGIRLLEKANFAKYVDAEDLWLSWKPFCTLCDCNYNVL